MYENNYFNGIIDLPVHFMTLYSAGLLWWKGSEVWQSMHDYLYCHRSVAGRLIRCHLSTALCNSILRHWTSVHLLLHAPGHGATVQP